MHHEKNNVHYWTYGNPKKPVLLLIHGFTGSHEGFQYIIPKLENDFSIIAPDLPGFGVSPLTLKDFTIAELATKTNEFVASLQLQEPPILVSHSMGGLVAAHMLKQQSDLFSKKTIFISPVAEKVQSIFDSRWGGYALGALQYGVGKSTGTFGDKLVRNKALTKIATSVIMTTSDKTLQSAIHDHHFNNLNYISSIRYYYELHKDINRQGVIDFAHKFRNLRICIIASEDDAVTPLTGEKKLALASGAQLITIPDVGHLAHYETPDAVASAIVDFL